MNLQVFLDQRGYVARNEGNATAIKVFSKETGEEVLCIEGKKTAEEYLKIFREKL